MPHSCFKRRGEVGRFFVSARHPALAMATPGASEPASLADRYKIAGEFENKLGKVRDAALLEAGLQHLSHFFGVCALTWATVVLLGGFASDLRTIDFYFVSVLLLLEAARLSSTVFFSKLVTKRLFKEEHDPERLTYKDEQPRMAAAIHQLAQATQSVFALSGLVIPSVRFVLANQQKLGGKHNLGPSLSIFYVLVLLNSVFATASVLCRLFVRGFFDLRLQSCHDEVFSRALNVGIVDAYDFDSLTFALQKLQHDFMRNLQPKAVLEQNEGLIKYLYAHPKGVEIVCQNLDSSDAFEQQVAANMVGFWAEEDRIDQQTVLLTRLAEKLGHPGKTSEAAANSFSALAKNWIEKDPNPLLIIRNSRNEDVVSILVNLVLNRVSSTLLVHVRALERLFRNQGIVRSVLSDAEKARELGEKLREILRPRGDTRRTGPRQRTKILAAVALLKLTETTEEDKQHIEGIDPATEPYVWMEETEMLDDLRSVLRLSPYNWQNGRPRIRPEPPQGRSWNWCIPGFLRLPNSVIGQIQAPSAFQVSLEAFLPNHTSIAP